MTAFQIIIAVQLGGATLATFIGNETYGMGTLGRWAANFAVWFFLWPLLTIVILGVLVNIALETLWPINSKPEKRT